jgi:hypothetical protein
VPALQVLERRLTVLEAVASAGRFVHLSRHLHVRLAEIARNATGVHQSP